MIKTIALALAATTLMAAPVMAAACSGSFALDMDWYTEAQLNEYNLNLLRGKGVDAARAEIWGGCIRAWVRVDGREEMQLNEPMGLRRVQ